MQNGATFAPEASGRIRLVRVVLIGLGLAAWFGTQALLARRALPAAGTRDALFTLTAGANAALHSHPAWADALLIVSSGLIDALGIFLLAWAIFGPTIRPFLGLAILFALRQFCQGLVALPAPEGMIWRHPGVPSLLVTYGTSGDLFFSGHTAIAVYAATELARLGRGWLTALAVALAVFEVATVIVLRAHYTMDVIAGVLAALWVAAVAGSVGEKVDRALARFGR